MNACLGQNFVIAGDAGPQDTGLVVHHGVRGLIFLIF
jgi:hypothetical protein